MKLASRASRPGCARLKDFTPKSMIIRAELDAPMNLTLSHITTSVPGCTTYLLPSGDRLLYFHGETIFYMT